MNENRAGVDLAALLIGAFLLGSLLFYMIGFMIGHVAGKADQVVYDHEISNRPSNSTETKP